MDLKVVLAIISSSFITLFCLKLFNQISWHWIFIFAPFWSPIMLLGIISILFLSTIAIYTFFNKNKT